MANSIGIGTRVFVGWCPDHEFGASKDFRGMTGVIEAGPETPGYDPVSGKCYRTDLGALWRIRVGTKAYCALEGLLTPIDDSDETQEVETEETEHA